MTNVIKVEKSRHKGETKSIRTYASQCDNSYIQHSIMVLRMHSSVHLGMYVYSLIRHSIL